MRSVIALPNSNKTWKRDAVALEIELSGRINPDEPAYALKIEPAGRFRMESFRGKRGLHYLQLKKAAEPIRAPPPKSERLTFRNVKIVRPLYIRVVELRQIVFEEIICWIPTNHLLRSAVHIIR